MIVVDANIIIYLWVPAYERYQSRELLIKDSNWWVPALYASEVRKVLLLHIRKNILKVKDAIQIMEKIESQFTYSTMEVPSKLVIALGNQSSCSAYDCEYAALAVLLECPLVTHDQQLIKSFPEIAFSVDKYLQTN